MALVAAETLLGRLKLRQIDGLSAHLVAYARADQPGPKVSDYVLVPISNPESLKAALAATLVWRTHVDHPDHDLDAMRRTDT